ncbi:MAG: hypothetical protein SPL13_00950, partial [Clostridia bacterium]|nr:hypothetical protein [Clostridia bacterium]
MLRRHELTELLGTNISNPDTPGEKLNSFINYLADNYSENENGGISLEEAIIIAKKAVGETVVYRREKEGLNEQDGNLLCNDRVYGAKGNWTVGFFMDYPRDAVQYLLVQARQNALKNGDPARAARFNTVAESIANKRHSFDTFSFYKGKCVHDMVNIERRFIGGGNAVDASFNANKAGFFDRIFRRTSRQYKDFEKEFKAYRADTRVEEGTNSREASRESVARTAKAYLARKIPGYNGGDKLPTLEQINRLRGKSRNRALFCYNVASATIDSAKTEQKFSTLVNTIEAQMKKDGTDIAANRLYSTNSIDAEQIKNVLSDVSPIEKVVGITGPTVKQELTDSQKDFQKSLARDLDDKPNGVDVQRLSKQMGEIE